MRGTWECWGFGKGPEGQNQVYGEDKYQGEGDVLRSGGDKIEPSKGII